jgi:transcriptional regulator with XRE-family HTH domain
LSQQFALKLRQRLREFGRTQKELCAACGITPQGLLLGLRRGTLSVRTLAVLSAQLEVPLWWWFAPGDEHPGVAAARAALDVACAALRVPGDEKNIPKTGLETGQNATLKIPKKGLKATRREKNLRVPDLELV